MRLHGSSDRDPRESGGYRLSSQWLRNAHNTCREDSRLLRQVEKFYGHELRYLNMAIGFQSKRRPYDARVIWRDRDSHLLSRLEATHDLFKRLKFRRDSRCIACQALFSGAPLQIGRAHV